MSVDAYPRTAPPGVPTALVKTGLWRCGFCKSGNHGSCPAMVRNGRLRLPSDDLTDPPTGPYRLVQCYCCGSGQPQRCLDCGNTEPQDLVDWACLYPAECLARVERRKNNDRLYQLLQRCKSEAAIRRRSIRISAGVIRAEVPDNEDELWEHVERANRKRATPRQQSGQCLCCGQATRGGSFLPGHDAKFKSQLRKRARQGDVAAQTELEQRGWL